MLKRFSPLLLLFLLAACTAPEPEPAQKQVIAMDTVMTFTAYGGQADTAVEQAAEQIRQMESQLSRTLPDSDVSHLNQSSPTLVGGAVGDLLLAAAHYYETTNGAFDITVAPVASAWGFTTDNFQIPNPAELETLLQFVDGSAVKAEKTPQGDYEAALASGQAIDLGGIAKGCASDLVAEIFRETQVERGKAEMGGNILVWGTRPDGSPWRVGILDPARPSEANAFAGILELENAFAITSGGYQRFFEADGKTYHHIIDPSTGYPADSGLTSVTVVADAREGAPGNGAMCDAYSTAFFILGENKTLEFWRNHQQRNGYEDAFDLVLVTADGRVLVTAGLADRFTPSEDSGYAYETVS